MYSGEEMDLGVPEFPQEDAAFFEELGFGDDLMFHPEEINILGDLMLSPALTLSDLEIIDHEMEGMIFTVTSETPGTSKMEDVKSPMVSGNPGTSKMEDVKSPMASETPGTSEIEDVKLTMTSEIPGTFKMGGMKLALTNRSTKATKVKVGVKGRRRRAISKATKVKDEITEVLRLRPPRKLKHRVSQHVPEDKKTEEYYEHRRKNTEAARKCRDKKRGVDEKRVEIIRKQYERVKELEAKVASLEHDNNIYKDVIAKLGQNPPVSQGPQSPQDHQRLPKKTRKSHRRDRK